MDYRAAPQEAVAEGEATPTVTFFDALEKQVTSSSDLSNALNSYLQSRDLQATGNISPPAQTPNKNEFNETTIIVPRSEASHRSREVKNLKPVNCPGLLELAPLKPTRSRSPSY